MYPDTNAPPPSYAVGNGAPVKQPLVQQPPYNPQAPPQQFSGQAPPQQFPGQAPPQQFPGQAPPQQFPGQSYQQNPYAAPTYNSGGIQPGYAPVAAPVHQSMQEPTYQGALAPLPGLLVRQQLRVKSLCVCCLKNKYDMGTLPQGLNPTDPWEDDVFKSRNGYLFADEHSECIDRVCCHRMRAFDMKIHAGPTKESPEVLRFERPFKCSICCCGVMFCPQEINTYDARTNTKLGSVQQDFRCCPLLCGKMYWKAYNPQGINTHVIERDVCCNENCCAPSCCCKIHKIDIKDPSEQQVIGSIENIFPGCSCRTLCCMNLIDNYRITFPTNSTPDDKANLLAGMMLIDYMLFANADDQQQ